MATVLDEDFAERTFWRTLVDALLLKDWNTRVVVVGTTLLGIAAGVIGTFAYLRKRALMGDALSHATLPGIAIAFILVGGKHLPALMLGAGISGVVGVLCVLAIRSTSRLKEDAAIGIVLSVFFGIGMMLLSIIQQLETGNEAGLQTFIYGKAAAMTRVDAQRIGAVALIVIVGACVLFKEFKLVCFDQAFSASLGYRVIAIDVAMMGMVVLATVVGLQAVGLILIVALLIVPAAAARFWTDRLVMMAVLAGGFGAISGWFGSILSALAPRLPTGAIIVLVAGALFVLSMLFAPKRGLTATWYRQWSLKRKIGYQNLLRALAEFEEAGGTGATPSFADVLRQRSWSVRELRRIAMRAMRKGLVATDGSALLSLTSDGRTQARRILRNHRLWELYLIRYAEVAASHVDRDADEIEHVLPETIIEDLEATLTQQPPIPPSPHGELASA